MTRQELILNMIIASRIVCRTSTGEVFSIKKDGTKKKLKTSLNGNGYDQVFLSWKGYKKAATVHQIVWIYSNLKPYDGRKNCIDHKDGNKHNNSIQNLRLVTYSENARGRKKTRFLNSSEKEKIHDMKKDGFTIPMIAEVFGVTHVTIRNTLNNKHKRK